MNIKGCVFSIIVACTAPFGASSAAMPGPDTAQHQMHATESSPGLVEQVRQVTAPYRDVRRAIQDGYGPFLGCVSGPLQGAMGIHFVNSTFVGDGELDVNHPEALIYETKFRTARLVGVEYLVLADAWHANHPEPPALEGQVFHFNESPNRFGLPAFYELHVWAWRDNPNGAFVDWNTRVSCEGQ